MKYEKEATTKNGRRTWKVTYELVRGPEPKPKHGGPKEASNQTRKKAEKGEAKPSRPINSQPTKLAPPQGQSKKRKAKGEGSQLGMF